MGVALAASLLIITTILLVRAAPSEERPRPAGRALELDIERDRASEVLAEYIRFDSSTPPGIGRDPRPPHLDLLIERYADPLGLEHRVFAGRTLLLTWRAEESAGRPLLLLSHSDVVPVAPDELDGWTYPPFDGVVDQGYIWGRGAIDDKGATIAQLEAIAALQAAGLGPRRDVILLISPDAEIGGERGVGEVLARHASHLEDPWAVLDEGTYVADDRIPNTRLVPVAAAEKRNVTITLTVVGEAGPSSAPRDNAAPRILSIALGRVAELEQEPRILPLTEIFLSRISNRMPLWQRVVLENRWLLSPFVDSILADRPISNASTRGSMALTTLRAGITDNVVPARATAALNLRLLPGTDLPEVLARIEAAVDDPRVTVEISRDEGASEVSSIDGPEWEALEAALASAYRGEDALITPAITPATTDGRYFARQGVPTYRLVPFILDANERGRVHGVDERISTSNLAEAARVYAHIMRYW